MTAALLGPDDPPAFEALNARGASRALLVCDHASCAIPAALGTLGLSAAARTDHIGWDIGAAAVTRRLSALLDAPAVLAGHSRLVIDCNRPASAPDRIPAESDSIPIPGNAKLDRAAVEARVETLFTPYHDAIRAALDRMTAAGATAAGTPPALISVHSFTPRLADGVARPWQIGICWDNDRRMAAPMIERLRAEGLVVGANEPYDFGVLTDYTVPAHAESRGLPYLLIEIRNDEIRTAAAVDTWSTRLATHLRALLEQPETPRSLDARGAGR